MMASGCGSSGMDLSMFMTVLILLVFLDLLAA
jgi:hypothetical protein